MLYNINIRCHLLVIFLIYNNFELYHYFSFQFESINYLKTINRNDLF